MRRMWKGALAGAVGVATLAAVTGAFGMHRNPDMIPMHPCTIIPQNTARMFFNRLFSACVDIHCEVEFFHDAELMTTRQADFHRPGDVRLSWRIDTSTWNLQEGDTVTTILTVTHTSGPDAGKVVTEELSMPVGAAQ